jgi:methyl-accepting chemotaxis protein
MKSTLTLRCFGVFLALDLSFNVLAIAAVTHALSISQYAVSIAALSIATVFKIVLWSISLWSFLAPYERMVTASAPTPNEIIAADHALQRVSLRFAGLYSVLWAASYGVALVWLWSLGVDRVPLGSGLAETGGLLVTAIFLGAFSFAFPIITILTATAAQTCSLAASAQSLSLRRNPHSLQVRIALVAFCIGTAPTLWVMALGYQKQLESGRTAAQIAATLAAADLARALDSADGPLAPDEIVSVVTTSAGPASSGYFLDRGGKPLGSASMRRGYDDAAELIRSHALAGPRTVLPALRSGRATAIERATSGSYAVVTVPSGGFAGSFAFDAGLFALVVVVWAPLCAFILGSVVSGPIRRLTEAARFVVEQGKLSAMGAIPVARADEIGELSVHFNELLDLMRSLGVAANAVAEGELRISVDGIGELPDAFRRMLASLTNIVQQIRETSVELASAAAEIFAAAQEQETAAAAQSTAMVEISRTMESLSESAAHVSDAVEGVLSNAEKTLNNTDDMVVRIGGLTSHANRIGEILEVIRDIADRSDLLALNGSLEASRAGDSGRGFALVAAEMRRLAERVTDSVQDVKKLVSDIRESGSSTVLATEESRKLADSTNEAARQITFVSQQQRSGTQQVSLSVKSVADVVTQAASATSQTRTAAENLKNHADRLEQVVRRFEIAEATRQDAR